MNRSIQHFISKTENYSAMIALSAFLQIEQFLKMLNELLKFNLQPMNSWIWNYEFYATTIRIGFRSNCQQVDQIDEMAEETYGEWKVTVRHNGLIHFRDKHHFRQCDVDFCYIAI